MSMTSSITLLHCLVCSESQLQKQTQTSDSCQTVWADSRLADGFVLRYVQAVGGVGELRRSVPGQDGDRGRRAFTTVSVHRLHPHQVLPAGGQRSTRGPDLTGATVHLEALVSTWDGRRDGEDKTKTDDADVTNDRTANSADGGTEVWCPFFINVLKHEAEQEI